MEQKTRKNSKNKSRFNRIKRSSPPPADERPDVMPYGRRPDRLIGVLSKEADGTCLLNPCSKKSERAYVIEPQELGGAVAGDVVLAKEKTEFMSGHPTARVQKRLGRATDPGILSLISAYEKSLPLHFNQAALAETENMSVPELAGRADLRRLPLVTIDGADARDFDDAVYAQPTHDGFYIVVAIADVSWYVRPGTALDDGALERGNSTYFPDRVIPMLPEKLSNDLCSLRPHEDRACMAAHMWIDRHGHLKNYRFERALMKSVARLTYDQVQAAKDGQPDDTTAPLMDTVINPLYAAFDVLRRARKARGTMDLEGREYKAVIDRTTGEIKGIAKRPSLDSHKVIEELMILANVAAPLALEDKGAPCIYRVHDEPPSADKVASLRRYLSTLGVHLPAEYPMHSSHFRQAIEKAKGKPHSDVVQEAVLRVQAKANYSTENNGHFGLVLDRYGHFTSPIRRYADLLIHRSLVDAFNMGAGGLEGIKHKKLSAMANHISERENISKAAERAADDRFAASFLAARVGQVFPGTIQNISRAGLFVRLDEIGATGLIPFSLLPDDDYISDEETRALKGRRYIFCAGEKMDVRLVGAEGLRGAIIIEPVNDNVPAPLPDQPSFLEKPRRERRRKRKSGRDLEM